MSEVLTIEEMEARYPAEWVLIDNPETDKQSGVTRGKVLFHDPDQDKVHEATLQLRPKHFAVFFMGPLFDDDVEYLL